jgi:hypothetical protein
MSPLLKNRIPLVYISSRMIGSETVLGGVPLTCDIDTITCDSTVYSCDQTIQ